MEEIVKKIVLKAKDEASGSLNDVTKAAGGLSNAFGHLQNIFTGFIAGKGFGKFISSAMDMESAMADVRKVVDFDTPEQFKEMNQQLLDMSTNIPMAATELAKITAAGGQLGIPRQELANFTDLTAKMAVAFDLSADEAGNSIAKLSNVLGVPIPQMKEIGDMFNHISNNMAATAPEITNVMLRVGAMGKTFGLSNDQTAALSATMLSLGTPSEIAATSMKNLMNTLSRVNSLTPRAEEALNGLGLSSSDIANMINSGNGQGAILKTLQHINSITDATEKMSYVSGLFGKEVAPEIIKLSSAYKTYGNAIDLVSNKQKYNNSMQKEFEARSDTTENQLQLLKNAGTKLAVTLGNSLLPAISFVVNGLGWFTDGVATLVDKIPPLKGLIIALGGALVGLQIYKTVSSITQLAKAFGAAIKASWLFNASLYGCPITWIIAGVAAFGTAVYALWDILDKGFEKSWVGKAWKWAFGDDKEDKEKENKNTEIYENNPTMQTLRELSGTSPKYTPINQTMPNIKYTPAGQATSIVSGGMSTKSSLEGVIRIENSSDRKISSSFDSENMDLGIEYGVATGY